MKLRIFAIFLLTVLYLFSSCRNEEKEKYLMEVEKALDRDIEWLDLELGNSCSKIIQAYLQEGKSKKFESIIDRIEKLSIHRDTLIYHYQLCSNSIIPILNKIENKNFLLSELISLKDIIDSIELKIVGPDFENFNKNLTPEIRTNNNRLKTGDSLISIVKLFGIPPGNQFKVFKAFVNLHEVDVGDVGSKYIIPKDSTLKMKPGKYSWSGEIEFVYKGKDTTFNFVEFFTIIPLICD